MEKLINLPESKDGNEQNWAFLLKSRNENMFMFPYWQHFETIFQNSKNLLDRLNHSISETTLRKIIVKNTSKTILNLVKRSLVWEFNLVRKKQKITLENFLINISSEAETIIFFKKYPVINIIFKRLIKNFDNFLTSLLIRLKEDRCDLERHFDLKNYNLKMISAEGNSLRKPHKTLIIFW